jgi:hypothetical protein
VVTKPQSRVVRAINESACERHHPPDPAALLDRHGAGRSRA